MLLYCMGEEADGVLDMSGISEGDRVKYDKVFENLDAHFKV